MHGHSVYRKFSESAGRFPNRVCLTAGGKSHSYAYIHQHARAVASYLQRELHVGVDDAVIVIAEQSHWWLVVSLAIQAIGAVEFPVDASKTPSEIAALVNQTNSKVLIVLDAEAAKRLWSVFAANQTLRLVCEADFGIGSERRFITLSEIFSAVGTATPTFVERFTAIAAVIATSGTTGEAKRVLVSHHSFLHAMRVVPRALQLRRSDVFLSCLPSWHLYARLVEYVAVATGGSIVYAPIPALAGALKSSGVTVFPSFPEIWENIYRQIISQIEKSKMRIFLRYAIRAVIQADRIYESWFGRARFDKPTPAFMAIGHLAYLLPLRWVLQQTIFRAVRRRVSPTLRYAIMGDAPLPLVVDETLRAIGFQVLEGYGSTEQCVTALRRPTRNFPGAVGRVLPGVHVTIEPIAGTIWQGTQLGEICVSGPNVFSGYFTGMPPQTSTAGTTKYRTGDIGLLDAHGNLVVVGRIANSFRLTNGELIFPELVENVLRGSRFVSWVVVTEGDDGTPVAIVVPDFHELLQWQASRSREPVQHNLAENPEQYADFWQPLLAGAALDLYTSEFEVLLKDSGLPAVARPTRIHLLGRRFHRGAELTRTLKPRRKQIREKFEGVIFAKRE